MFKDTTIGAVIARLRSMVTIIIIEREEGGRKPYKGRGWLCSIRYAHASMKKGW